jgi:hypothetical protein
VSSDEIARIRRDADSALWGLFAEVRELPDVDEWQEMPERAREAFDYYWSSECMANDLGALEHWHREGVLSGEQEERYALLKAELEEALPTIDKLGLARPGEILER